MYRENNQSSKQNIAPIAVAMEKYAADGALAFHTPGHKQGLGAHPLLKKLITPDGLRQEVSLMEELDDLHAPFGCIKEAEELAAELWGARETLFIINGTTCAIQAMLMGTLHPGDRVLVPRNAHRSMIEGIILAGAVPIYIMPEYSDLLGIPMGLSVNAVMRAIAEHPEAKALAVVYPNYYGFCCDLQQIARLVHGKGMLLLVDEAHGAHLRFSDSLPLQALDAGADVVAQSTHKLLGSMTQTSMLHIGSERVDAGRIRQCAGLLQSTSPNQLLLASLDIARLQMAQEGRERMTQAVSLAGQLRQKINDIDELYCPGWDLCFSDSNSGAAALDTTKVTVNLRGLPLSGYQAELILRHKYKVQCELSDRENLLFIISMADTVRTTVSLLEALKKLVREYGTGTTDRQESGIDSALLACCEPKSDYEHMAAADMAPFPIPLQRMSPRRAFCSPAEEIPLADSLGRISSETLAFYPPGIPFLCPGEEITQEVADYAADNMQRGRRMSGLADREMVMIRVCKE